METHITSSETTLYFEKRLHEEIETKENVHLVDERQSDVLPERQTALSKEEAEKNSTKAAPEYKHEFVTGIKFYSIMIPVTLAYFLLMLDSSIISTAIPEITSRFDSLLDVGWYGSAYQLASSAFQPLSGKIYTYFSTKWSFLTFFFIFEVGSAICGAAQSSVMFIIGRGIAGLGSSGLMNGAFTVIAATLPTHKQPMVMGINVGLGQLGIACGPLIGGAFTEYVSWRWCFYINLPLGAIVALLLIFLEIPETSPKRPVREVLSTAVKSLDLPGFMIIAPAAVMFFLALQFGGNQFAWGSSTVIGLFVGAGVTFAIFLVWESHEGDNAMIPLALLRQRIIWSASGTMFFFLGVLFISIYYLPIYFQAVKNDTALMSGVHLMPTILAQITLAMTSGVLVQTLGYYLPLVLGGTALSAIGCGLLSLLGPSTSVGQWVGFQIVFGIGCGSAATGSFIAIQNLVPAPQIPTAMAILIFSQNLGAAVSLVASQTVFSNTLRNEIKKNLPGVNPEPIIAVGARDIRKLVSGEDLVQVLKAYSTSIDRVMYYGVAAGVAAFVFACGLGFKDVRVKKDKPEAD